MGTAEVLVNRDKKENSVIPFVGVHMLEHACERHGNLKFSFSLYSQILQNLEVSLTELGPYFKGFQDMHTSLSIERFSRILGLYMKS